MKDGATKLMPLFIFDQPLVQDDGRLRNVISALQSSAHALSKDPQQLGTQLLARLDVESMQSGHDALGVRLLESAYAFARHHRTLTTVSASLGSIRERLRSTNIVRELSGCGEHTSPSRMCVVNDWNSKQPVVVGIVRNPLDAHVVVHSLNSGALLHRIRLNGEDNEEGQGAQGIQCSDVVVVGASPQFEFVVTSHCSGWMMLWDVDNSTESLQQFGTYSHFKLSGGHTEHVSSVDFSYALEETKKRAAADHSNGMDRKDRKDRKGRKKSAERSGGIRERGGAGPTFLVTAGHDGNVCVWNIATRCLISRRTGSWGLVEDVVFTHFKSMHQVCFTCGNTLMLWNLEMDQEIPFKLPKNDVGTHLTVVNLPVSRSFRIARLIVGFQSGMILSCLTSEPRMIHTAARIGSRTTVHRGSLTSLVPFGSGVGTMSQGNVSCDTIVSSSNVDRPIRMWSVTSGTLLHKIDVTAVYWLGVMTEWSLCVGTHAKNGAVSVLDVAKPHDPPRATAALAALAALATAPTLYSGIVVTKQNKNIPGATTVVVRGHGGSQVVAICISLNTFVVVSGSYDGRVCVWCGCTGRLMHTMKEDSWLTCTSVAVNTKGNVITTGTTYRVGSSNLIRPCLTCWRLKWDEEQKQTKSTRSKTKQNNRQQNSAQQQQMSPLRSQSMVIQKVLNNFAVEGTVDAMSFCKNEIRMLTATSDYQIRLWNVGGGPKMGTMEMRYAGQPQTILRLGTFGGIDGMRYVWAEGTDGSYRKWNRLTGIKGIDKTGGSSKFITLKCKMMESSGGRCGVFILDSSRRISCWDLVKDVMEEKNVLDAESSSVCSSASSTKSSNKNNNNNTTNTNNTNKNNVNHTNIAPPSPSPPISFCSLACWSNENKSTGEMVVVWSKQKNIFMTQVNPSNTRTFNDAPIISLVGMTDTVSCLVVSNDGRHVVAGSHEGEIVWWDLKGKNNRTNTVTNTNTTAAIQPTRRIREINLESNATVQYLHISKNSKQCVVVTWDEVFVYQFSGGRTLGKRPIEEYFISHACCLDNGAVLLIGDDRPRLWTLVPEEEIVEDNESKQAALKRWHQIKKQVKDNIKNYDRFQSAFAPKLSDECSVLAVQEPTQKMFAVGFCDGGLCAWRRSSTQVFATTVLPGGLPVSALVWLTPKNQVNQVIACCGTMCYRVQLGRPNCAVLMKIPLKSWVPPKMPMFLSLRPDFAVLHTTVPAEIQETTLPFEQLETNTTAKKILSTVVESIEQTVEERFYIDRGDRIDASHYLTNVHREPVVALGTKQGRVHIIRRGGRIEIEKTVPIEALHSVVVVLENTLNLSLTGLNKCYNQRAKDPEEVEREEEARMQLIDTIDMIEMIDIQRHPQKNSSSSSGSKYSLTIDAAVVGTDAEKDPVETTVEQKKKTAWALKRERIQLQCMYWVIDQLRKQGMTIWPYHHGYPGVAKGLRPHRYRRLQKMMTRRNLALMKLYLLVAVALMLFVLVFLFVAVYLIFEPPVRRISKIEIVPWENKSHGISVTTVVAKVTTVECYDKARITNQTELWKLGNSSMLCDCVDFTTETKCNQGVGLVSNCEWDEENENCGREIVKVCTDVPPTAGESCKMYRGFGKCGAKFMIGFCCKTCFACEC